MCIESMDTKSKHNKSDYLRGTMKPGAKPRWKFPPRFITEETAEAFTHCRPNSMRTMQKCPPRQPKRSQLDNIARVLGHIGKKKVGRRSIAACLQHKQPGAMAPENTTQYIMANTYDDMKIDDDAYETTQISQEPQSVDSGYDCCLAFQQKHFEEEFALYWQPE